MTPTVESLRGAGVLSALDFHFARAVARIGGDAREEVALAAAMVSRHVGNGHVCLDLRNLCAVDVLYDDAGEPSVRPSWLPFERWCELLRSSPLIRDGEAPLVLDAAGRLYLRRYWEHEERLAAKLRVRAVEPLADVDGAWLRDALDRLFPPDAASGEVDWQRVAAVVALLRRFCVISGGPGTGKTHTVAKILALLVEQEVRRGRRPPRFELLAPTGKAAARMAELIRNVRGSLPCEDAVREAIPEEAATIHRRLGSIGGTSTNFRHHAGNPLVADVVLVDEASMVPMALMSRLVDALPAHARLILLGDQDQLASVEAGAVLGDICNTGAARSYSRGLIAAVERLGGGRLPGDAASPERTGIWDCIVQLTRSYRYGPDSGIGRLARAVNAGDAARVAEILAEGRCDDIARAEPGEPGGLSPVLTGAVRQGFGAVLADPDPRARLDALDRFRVLCAHRRGEFGVEGVNRHIEAALAEAGLIVPGGAAYPGRPVIVTHNDYTLKLFNGDVGIVAADPEREAGGLVWFRGAGGTVRRLSPSRLPPHETVYAMSVHKSQGSEFDEVAVLLPERPSPVVTRELLYTAITRARRRVVLHAARDLIAHAVGHRTERDSGLRDRLWGSADGP